MTEKEKKEIQNILYDMYDLPNESYVFVPARGREVEYLVQKLEMLGLKIVKIRKGFVSGQGNIEG